MRYLIGVDDTDFGESIGTGALARELASFLALRHGATVAGITRHQLLVHPDIPYTSHNSAACLAVDSARSAADLAAAGREFVEFLFHPGADPGLCVAAVEDASAPELQDFGRRAQVEIVKREEARALVTGRPIILEELGGTGLGMIGALAACGLRASGEDGRFISLPGARALSGPKTVAELKRAVAIDRVVDRSGRTLADDCVVETRGWIRPDLRGGVVVLLVEGEQNHYSVVREKRGDE
jgi:hypothetical protein